MRLRDSRVIVANDNTLPFSGGREIGRAADNELILLPVPGRLAPR